MYNMYMIVNERCRRKKEVAKAIEATKQHNTHNAVTFVKKYCILFCCIASIKLVINDCTALCPLGIECTVERKVPVCVYACVRVCACVYVCACVPVCVCACVC